MSAVAEVVTHASVVRSEKRAKDAARRASRDADLARQAVDSFATSARPSRAALDDAVRALLPDAEPALRAALLAAATALCTRTATVDVRARLLKLADDVGRLEVLLAAAAGLPDDAFGELSTATVAERMESAQWHLDAAVRAATDSRELAATATELLSSAMRTVPHRRTVLAAGPGREHELRAEAMRELSAADTASAKVAGRVEETADAAERCAEQTATALAKVRAALAGE